MAKKLAFEAIKVRQGGRHAVCAFATTAREVFEIARIERAGRTKTGNLFGFQRPQIAQHILEIRDYLRRDDAVLPNSIVLAFVDSIKVTEINRSIVEFEIDVTAGPPGVVVDGQQRLSALQPIQDRDFEILVSAILCRNEEELRRQFILVNNTRPLPKELIYELLPTVRGLPHRLSVRSFAASLTAKLNHEDESSLRSKIRQHTNPSGVLSSNAIQRVIMNSRSNGAVRELVCLPDGEARAFALLSDFYAAVQEVFPEAWIERNPKTSRLVHGAGLIALGFVMEVAFAIHGARQRDDFSECLRCLVPYVAWTSGTWNFRSEQRPWNKIQNTPADIRLLSDYLVRIVRDRGISMEEMDPTTRPEVREDERAVPAS